MKSTDKIREMRDTAASTVRELVARVQELQHEMQAMSDHYALKQQELNQLVSKITAEQAALTSLNMVLDEDVPASAEAATQQKRKQVK